MFAHVIYIDFSIFKCYNELALTKDGTDTVTLFPPFFDLTRHALAMTVRAAKQSREKFE